MAMLDRVYLEGLKVLYVQEMRRMKNLLEEAREADCAAQDYALGFYKASGWSVDILAPVPQEILDVLR